MGTGRVAVNQKVRPSIKGARTGTVTVKQEVRPATEGVRSK
jgi:hypothetical protein